VKLLVAISMPAILQKRDCRVLIGVYRESESNDGKRAEEEWGRRGC